MALRMRPTVDESLRMLSVPCELACGVCGRRALVAGEVDAVGDGLSDRWVCQICGAHRVVPRNA